MDNKTLLEYIVNNNVVFSSLELCISKGVCRIAIKSYNKRMLYDLVHDKSIIEVLDRLPENEFMKLEYGICFDNDVTKIYYIDNTLSVIGIDIFNGTIVRTKKYSVDFSGNILASEETLPGVFETSTYYSVNSIYEFKDTNIIKQLLNFEEDCDYAFNIDKQQYYVRIYYKDFKKYYNHMLEICK